MRSIFRRTAALALITGLTLGPVALAQAAQESNYADASYVQIKLGATNQIDGVKLVDGQPDGVTESLTEGGRRSMPGTGQERFFYFDVDDTYVNGGSNQVVLMITYLDKGLLPVVLEYDAYDPFRPHMTTEDLTKKRIVIVPARTNSEVWKTARVELNDARFGTHVPGGADFRVGSADELLISNVSVWRMSHEDAPKQIRVVLDGHEISFGDAEPYLDPQSSSVVVPMRRLFNALGVPDTDITWDGVNRRVEARKGQTTIQLVVDSPFAVVGADMKQLLQPAVIKGGRTMVPLRFVSETFGLKVEWDGVNRLVTLTSLPPAPPATDPATQTAPTAPTNPSEQPPDKR